MPHWPGAPAHYASQPGQRPGCGASSDGTPVGSLGKLRPRSAPHGAQHPRQRRVSRSEPTRGHVAHARCITATAPAPTATHAPHAAQNGRRGTHGRGAVTDCWLQFIQTRWESPVKHVVRHCMSSDGCRPSSNARTCSLAACTTRFGRPLHL